MDHHKVSYLKEGSQIFCIVHPSSASYGEPIDCGHCNNRIIPILLLTRLDKNKVPLNKNIYICPECKLGINQISQTVYQPKGKFGKEITGLPSEIKASYEEARACMSVSAYFGAELLARRLLMHVCIEKGADEGKSFAHYIDYLEAQGFLTANMKPWVDTIRTIGNEATHRITDPDSKRAELSLTFLEMLLRNMYEMPHRLSVFSVES